MPKVVVLSDLSRIRTLAHTPAAAVAVDDVVVINGRVCVAYSDVAADAEGQFIHAAHELDAPKAAVVITEGDAAYYDAVAELFTNVATDNTKCGMWRKAAVALDETGSLELDNGFAV